MIPVAGPEKPVHWSLAVAPLAAPIFLQLLVPAMSAGILASRTSAGCVGVGVALTVGDVLGLAPLVWLGGGVDVAAVVLAWNGVRCATAAIPR
jgi:hypothetical protein